MAKGGGHLTDGNTFDNSSRIEPKRSHQWFADTAEIDVFPNKKQAVQAPNIKSTAGLFDANPFQSVPNQFIDRLFGSETTGPINFADINIAPDKSDNSNTRNKGIIDQFEKDSRGLSISPRSYGGIRKVKVNQVRESDSGPHEPEEHNSEIPMGQIYNRGNETGFISMSQTYSNEDESAMIMGPTYIRSVASSEKENYDVMPIIHSYNKDDTDTISFGGFHEEPDINLLARPISSYRLNDQLSFQTSEIPNTLSASQVAKSRSETLSKIKAEVMDRKEAPNSFPSNVRSLISTGMLDGVPVKYVSVSRQELPGVIKGSGYLCGCQSCNYSKVLNAYEFERHAGPKTKHPNNHIYFVNGKTIYQIVQELRSTPESLLFDTIQTVTGSPINQKSFRAWKESFQAASRELRRIYGREDLNL